MTHPRSLESELFPGLDLLSFKDIIVMWCRVILLLAALQPKEGLACEMDDKTCTFKLEIESRLTMMYESTRVMPLDGGLYDSTDKSKTLLEESITSKVLTADGVYARRVISINGQFPGPELIMYEGQNIEVEVINKLNTDGVTVHFHGLHQWGTQWADGVAYVTQCPVLPGTSFRYKFNALPAGTHWYHAHIGDQRGMGLYGPLIIKKKNQSQDIIDEHVLILQDWNHDMDTETAYLKSQFGIYDCDENGNLCTRYNNTHTIDGAGFGPFEFHSGLVNGKGRYHYGPGPLEHNGAPLTKFTVQQGKKYRFRVISAAVMYPLRVYVTGHRLTIVASDGWGLKHEAVDSFVIQTGERYDFYLEANQSDASDYMIKAESLEVGKEQMHVAEAILHYSNNPGMNKPLISEERECTQTDHCIVFNCPYLRYPVSQNRNCTTYNSVSGNGEDNEQNRRQILNATNVRRFFLNFGFAGGKASVNGRKFAFPNVAALTQPQEVGPSCADQDCGRNKTCTCAYAIKINDGEIVELVFLNMGNGKGASHPIHLHGHSFYVIYYGFPDYGTDGKIQSSNGDIKCEDDFCNDATWSESRSQPEFAATRIPPLKDTLIVPTGGYVQVRFKADNPGVWFLHCHIDLHNTEGMAMMVNESFSQYSKGSFPENFPKCGNFNPIFQTNSQTTSSGKVAGVSQGGVFLLLFLYQLCRIVLDGLVDD